MRTRRRMSLKRLTFYQLSCAIVLLIVSLLIGFMLFASTRLIEQVEDTSAQNLSIIAQKLDMMTDEVQNSAVMMLSGEYIQDWLKNVKATGTASSVETVALRQYLYTMSRAQFISNIVVCPVNNSEIVQSLYPYSDPEEEEIFSLFYASDDRTMWCYRQGLMFRNRAKGTPTNVLCYYQKVYSAWTMEPLGVIQIMIDEKEIANLYREIELGTTGYYCILDESNIVVSAVNKSLIGSDYDSWVDGIPETTRIRIQMDGERALFLRKRYARLDWTLAGIVRVAEISGVVWRRMIVFSAILMVAGISIALLFASACAASLSNPIIQLKNAMIKVGEGERDIQLHLDRQDEIGELNRQFLHMLSEMDILNAQVLDEQNEKKEMELALVLSQLSPHFLYNSLECICGLSAMGKNEDAIQALNALSRFYRGVFYAKDRLTTVEEELEVARNYFSIMEYRFPGKLHYSIDCEECVRKLSIVNMVLQPVLENAIFHGLRNSRRPWQVEVNAYQNGGDVEISVWDNGVGMSEALIHSIFLEEPSNTRAHFGLRATDERMHQICGEGYGLQVYSTPGGGTMIVANFPCDLRERVSNV